MLIIGTPKYSSCHGFWMVEHSRSKAGVASLDLLAPDRVMQCPACATFFDVHLEWHQYDGQRWTITGWSVTAREAPPANEPTVPTPPNRFARFNPWV